MKRARLALLALGLAAGALGGACDWIHFNFMNSIPFKGNPKANPDVYVYLGIDGLSYYTTLDVMKHGGFQGGQGTGFHLSKFITMFPGTSDASWTRIMHTEKLGGYEIEYYSPVTDSIHNQGLAGLAKHLMPAISESISFEAKYLDAFDFRANGYMHAVDAYRDTFVSKAKTIDNLFVMLGGRSQTQPVFSAYLLEFDVMGHMKSPEDVAAALRVLSDRIAKFKRDHPERRYHFTIFSDHGMNFTQVRGEKLIHFDEALTKVGVTPVKSLLDHDPKRELVAIPIEHTRVTYVALHTHADSVPEVAGRVASIPSVDLAVSRLKAPDTEPGAAAGGDPIDWFAIWADGKRQVYFGFNRRTDEYLLPRDQNYERIGLKLAFDAGQAFKAMTDDALFQLSKHLTYPDVLFRARTSLEPIGADYPADIMVSFRTSFAEIGFQLPGTDDIASSGFHGAMEELATMGTLLSDERELPDAVRSDNLMELFPRFRDHTAKKVTLIPGDANASLRY